MGKRKEEGRVENVKMSRKQMRGREEEDKAEREREIGEVRGKEIRGSKE